MIGTIRVSILLLLLILLPGCFGATLFSIVPIPVKPGDIVSKPITKSILNDSKIKLDKK